MACMISACVFITNGPYCATGSPMGRPCSTRHSTVVGPVLVSSQSSVARTCSAAWRSTSCGPTRRLSPTKKYSMRCVPSPCAAGRVHSAPGSMRSVQMATSPSGCEAQDSGGGARGSGAPGSAPATTVTVVARPAASLCTRRGMRSSHSMVKCGSTILFLAGRFSQIWNSSSGLGSVALSSGNISECTMPLPAVTHCTSPPPKRAAAPSESEWSIRPLRTSVTVSKPRCGWPGKPGTVSPWYMLQPSLPLKSLPIWRSSTGTAGPNAALPAG